MKSRTDLGRENPLRAVFDNRPPWADLLLVRRMLAAALTVLAAVLFLRGDPDTHPVHVVVAERDLPPGRLLEAGDLRSAVYESGSLPTHAVRDTGALLGSTLTGAMRAGEVFTDLRVVSPRLAAVASGAADARIVPIRLADNAVAEILRAGDRVDVVGTEDGGDRPARTLARDAAVVLVSRPADRRGQPEPVVLVAMDAAHATAVAAASLRTALTVVFH
ncbi:SAF domain-containing protein [Nocardia goodfellowii]|uniref:Flp pilus assembly protein CpaB n=1 Tax=Nocardia goodfellowii TaxID=882446 RepID=A0ABS4QBE1_9NOCA|nr:SAF domain-containing protein [Nocardia goodfellowii]MBP2189015.1 Flp pilus assembly protein CpaB [Nocardia goodfellowii]